MSLTEFLLIFLILVAEYINNRNLIQIMQYLEEKEKQEQEQEKGENYEDS